ncbi:hypothetical protein [Streptomyces sp. NBC_00670]|jgi:hypothetical protein|uniref:hypothetical protein n=1 Tax=Streptomyces sp. NBC_00670 TaxID=2975804 RepID=UPI002E309090|nr:hypothetical protein [Streptomyces sp. NBC_00670]
MYGHGMQPPARTPGSVIAIRVLVFLGSFFSIGLLSFLPLFRIAVLSRRARDWLFAVVSVPLIITCFAVVGSLPESNPLTDVGIIVLLLLGAGSGTYYILFDMRRRQSPLYGPGPQTGAVYPPGPRQGYGYPAPPQQPYANRQTPIPPQPYAATQAAPAPQPQPPYQPGPASTPIPNSAENTAGRPGPARIDQVRAELDELSDYLRKQEGDR